MKKTSFKQLVKKEIKEEIIDIQQEREEAEQRRLEAEAELAREYEEDFMKEKEREEWEFLAQQDSDSQFFIDPDYPESA